MGGRTFRSRWVVRWGLIVGGLCLAASLVLVVLAARNLEQRSGTGSPAGATTTTAKGAKGGPGKGGSGGGGKATTTTAATATSACDDTTAARADDQTTGCAVTAGAGAYEDVKGFAAAGVLFVLGVSQLVGAARIGITLAGPGIIVRNPLRTHRIRWADIEGFGTDLGTTGQLSYGFGRVYLADGTTQRIEAICAMPWEPKDHFADQRVIDALNAELAARKEELAAGAAVGSGAAEGHVVDDQGGAGGTAG